MSYQERRPLDVSMRKRRVRPAYKSGRCAKCGGHIMRGAPIAFHAKAKQAWHAEHLES